MMMPFSQTNKNTMEININEIIESKNATSTNIDDIIDETILKCAGQGITFTRLLHGGSKQDWDTASAFEWEIIARALAYRILHKTSP
jgi:hypothetical protein